MTGLSSQQATNWREGRRLRAWELSQEGWPQQRIAEALGVTKGAVSQWLSRTRTQGPQALRNCKPPGRQPNWPTSSGSSYWNCWPRGQRPLAPVATSGPSQGWPRSSDATSGSNTTFPRWGASGAWAYVAVTGLTAVKAVSLEAWW